MVTPRYCALQGWSGVGRSGEVTRPLGGDRPARGKTAGRFFLSLALEPLSWRRTIILKARMGNASAGEAKGIETKTPLLARFLGLGAPLALFPRARLPIPGADRAPLRRMALPSGRRPLGEAGRLLSLL